MRSTSWTPPATTQLGYATGDTFSSGLGWEGRDVLIDAPAGDMLLRGPPSRSNALHAKRSRAQGFVLSRLLGQMKK